LRNIGDVHGLRDHALAPLAGATQVDVSVHGIECVDAGDHELLVEHAIAVDRLLLQRGLASDLTRRGVEREDVGWPGVHDRVTIGEVKPALECLQIPEAACLRLRRRRSPVAERIRDQLGLGDRRRVAGARG
jgi:hypothetical protein